MKIYFYMNFESFSNCYLVANEETKQALIIDPAKISENIINQIEDYGYTLCAALITHNHSGHTRGLLTLKKIYDIDVFAADPEIVADSTTIIKGDGTLHAAGFDVDFFSLPGHSSDSMVYKIGNVLFTGDTINAGVIGLTTSNYSRILLVAGIKSKILTHSDDTIIMPGHGPMTSVGAEKNFNIDL